MRVAHREMLRKAPALLLALAVGLAFADTAIVMLGLPEIYSQFGGSVIEVSLVATSYNLVVAVAAFALLPLVRRVRPAPVAAGGLALFAATTIGAGLSSSLTELVAWRSAQGLGAAMLLAASLTLLTALADVPSNGRAWWALAGTAGAALGPALGGLLTELFDWRAIFLAQAPVAALALLGALAPAARRVRPETGRRALNPEARRANWGLVFAFGGLAGALFLAVLMVVTVWDMGPLLGAVVVSSLPAAALAVRRAGADAPDEVRGAAGALLLSLGLAALAFLPATHPAWAAAALAVCGAGFGLLVPVLTRRSIDAEAPGPSSAISVGARHVGLVLALVAIAPLLASELEDGAERATREATASVLDADLPLRQKIPIAQDLGEAFQRAPDGEVPDLRAPFEKEGVDDAQVAAAASDLETRVQEAITASFRSSYLLAAGVALLALIPLGAGTATWRSLRTRPSPALGAVCAAALALVVVELGAGGAQLGSGSLHDPCNPRQASDAGGFDATLQQIARDGLDGAACELGLSREELVLAFAPDAPGAPEVEMFDRATIERAARAGLVAAVDDAEDRGSIDGVTATVLREASRRAPIDEAIALYEGRGGLIGRLTDLIS